VANHVINGVEYTNASVENMVAFLTDYPKTSIAYFGFIFTMIVAAFATSHGVGPTMVGWMLLIGLTATATFIAFYMLMDLLNVFKPILDVLLKMLDTIDEMLKVVDNLLESIVKVVDSITSVFKTIADTINSIFSIL